MRQWGGSYTNASYSLDGIATNETTVQEKKFNICLNDTKGEINKTKGYGVANILKEDWSYPALTSLSKGFPKTPTIIFDEQNAKSIDLLIGKDFLKLMPKCINGLECKSCENGLCCYRSRFGLGWVPVEECNNIGFYIISCPFTLTLCLQQVISSTKEFINLDKSSDTNLVSSFSSWKSLNKKHIYCSLDKMLYSTQKEPENRYLIDQIGLSEILI